MTEKNVENPMDDIEDSYDDVDFFNDAIMKSCLHTTLNAVKVDTKPKYTVGQKVIVSNWGGKTEPLEILDIQETYHHRLGEYTWGYKMDGETGLTMAYVPEGYLRICARYDSKD